jgi:hypothetical protein
MCLEREIPPGLQNREEVRDWRKKLLACIIKGELGPVHKFFLEKRDMTSVMPENFYKVLPLKRAIKALSAETMGAILGSDALQLHREEEVYYLLGAWLHQSSHVKVEERVSIYKQLVEKIRFHHISSEYLGCIVTSCPLAIDSGLALSLLQSALVNRNVGKNLAEIEKVDLGPKNRDSTSKKWVLNAKLMLEDLMKIKRSTDKIVWKMVGLAGGVPVMLKVVPDVLKEKTVGVYIRILMPPSPPGSERLRGGLKRRMGFHITIKLGSKKKPQPHFFEDDGGYGIHDFFGKPWREVVCAGSSYFPGGKLAVELTVTKKWRAKKQHQEGEQEEEEEEEEEE